MDDLQQPASKLFLVNSDLNFADKLIEQLDREIQHTGNLELSKTLNDISDSYETIRSLLNRPKKETQP